MCRPEQSQIRAPGGAAAGLSPAAGRTASIRPLRISTVACSIVLSGRAWTVALVRACHEGSSWRGPLAGGFRGDTGWLAQPASAKNPSVAAATEARACHASALLLMI